MKEIQRISVTDAVVDSIRELIETGSHPVGEKLPTEVNLCKILNVSRTSVREALRVLQTLGYVELRPGKGAYVADYQRKRSSSNWYDVDSAKFCDFMEVRFAIETLSIRLSVERATDEQVNELEEVHRAFVDATKNQDHVQALMLDELFHSKIIDFTNNRLLININQQLLSAFRVYRTKSFTDKSVYQNAVDPHARILTCFHTRDTNQAVVEMTRHLEITKQDMEQLSLVHQTP